LLIPEAGFGLALLMRSYGFEAKRTVSTVQITKKVDSVRGRQ
jgi:hypothetical protein